MERKLAAILVADAVGYSRLMSISERETYAQVKADLAEVFGRRIAETGGQVVKTTGDGLMAEFRSVLAAVDCAIEIQRTFWTDATRSASGSDLLYRIGINLGEIIAEPGDIYGDAVNVAVRLQQLAEPGAIAVSAPVRRALGHRADLEISDLGDRRVKNLGDPLRVYRIRLPCARQPGGGPPAPFGVRRQGATGSVTRAALAISPFRSVGKDRADSRLSDGITATLTNHLAGCADLVVMPLAWTSRPPYPGRHGLPGAEAPIAGMPEARFMLDGSVHRVGGQVRVTAQLMDHDVGHYVWAERFDLPLDDPLRLETDLADLILDRLTQRGGGRAAVALHPRPIGNAEAGACVHRGRDLMIDFDPAANRRARACFETAIELDPQLCEAYAGLANVCWREAQYTWSDAPEASLKTALELARTAVALDPTAPWPHAVFAAAKLTSGWLNAAIMEFHAALRIAPAHADSLAFLAEALVAAGRPAEAIGCIDKALRANPAPPDWYYWNLGLACYALGHYDRAIATFRRIDHLAEPRRLLAACLAQSGDLEAAHREADGFLIANPNFSTRAWVQSQAFLNDGDAEHFAQGYLRAGLPR